MDIQNLSVQQSIDPGAICIVSGCTHRRFDTDRNHRRYAAVHGYDYRFDMGPYADLQNPYFFKLRAVENALPDYAWVLWLDDDAFFTDFTIQLETFIEMAGARFLVVCRSPVNAQGQYTFLNSGVFLVRRCAEAFAWLRAAQSALLEDVAAWWDSGRFGMYTATDQDAVVYALHRHDLMTQVLLLHPDAFNSRPYHYRDAANDHFIVHFPGVPDKPAAFREFALRYGLDDELSPRASAPATNP